MMYQVLQNRDFSLAAQICGWRRLRGQAVLQVNANVGYSNTNYSAVPEGDWIRSQCLIYCVKKQLYFIFFIGKQRQLCYSLWASALFHLGKQQGTTELVEALLVNPQQPPGSYSLSGSSARWMCLFLSLMQGIQVCDPSAPHASPYGCIDWSQRKSIKKWQASMHQRKNRSSTAPEEPSHTPLTKQVI